MTEKHSGEPLGSSQEIVDHYCGRFYDLLAMSDVPVPEQIKLEVSTGRTTGDVPAELVHSANFQGASLIYEPATVASLQRVYEEDGNESVAQFVERFYIAGGIAFGVLKNAIDPRDRYKIHAFARQLISIRALSKCVEQDANFAFEHQDRLIQSLSDLRPPKKSAEDELQELHGEDSVADGRQMVDQADAQQRLEEKKKRAENNAHLTRIAALRYAAGLCTLLWDESVGMQNLASNARLDLCSILNDTMDYEAIMQGLGGKPKGDPFWQIGALSADVSIGLAFPMTPDEIKAMLKIVSSDATEQHIITEDEVFKNDLLTNAEQFPEGFDYEKAQITDNQASLRSLRLTVRSLRPNSGQGRGAVDS